jgi:hypothetical protein
MLCAQKGIGPLVHGAVLELPGLIAEGAAELDLTILTGGIEVRDDLEGRLG